jgi:hypothetical protein
MQWLDWDHKHCLHMCKMWYGIALFIYHYNTDAPVGSKIEYKKKAEFNK